MSSRRVFLKTVAGVTTSVLAAQALGQQRRRVYIGNRRATVVDIHAHCVIPETYDVVSGSPLARNAPRSQILGSERIESMDQRGIDIQALSINRYWWYEADRKLARSIVKINDEGLADWCSRHSDRFVGLTSVALQFPELAAAQLEYAVTSLGLRGASVGGHVNGEVPSSPKYDPFWAKAQELGVTVFVHPHGAENVVREGALDGRGDLGNIIGNPLETTVFLSRMIYDGTLDRFPGLKISAAHGGGYLPSYLGRSEAACTYRGSANCANRKPPSEYLKDQVFADTMVFSEEGLRHLVAEMGASQILYGSDLPFDWPDTIDLVVDSSFLSDDDKLAILGENLVSLLRIAG